MSNDDYKIYVKIGNTLDTILVEYEDSDGVAIPLTGFTATFQIREKLSAPDVILETHPAVDAPNGTVSLTLTAAQTETISQGNWVYGLEVTHSSGEPSIPLLQGPLIAELQVVR